MYLFSHSISTAYTDWALNGLGFRLKLLMEHMSVFKYEWYAHMNDVKRK